MRLLFTSLLSFFLTFSLFGQGPCNNQTSVTYQGYEYDIVEIGGQCWFAKNLNATSFNNGDPLLQLESNEQWFNATESGYCRESEELGAIYNGYAVTDERSLCPNGWHVNTSEDWHNLLIQYGDFTALEQGWYCDAFNPFAIVGWGNGNNNTGLNIMQSGYRNPNGNWNSSQPAIYKTNNNSYEFSPTVNFCGEADVSRVYGSNSFDIGGSIRCVTNQLIVQIPGCTDPTASNYNPDATDDDGSCLYSTLDYDGNGDGCVDGEDLLNFLTEYGQCD